MRLRIGVRLFFAGVRGMVGPDAVDDALGEALPEAVAMRSVTDRWVELGQSTEPLVAVGRGKGEMRRRRLCGRDILVLGQEQGFVAGRNVQDMDALAGLAGELDEALRAHQRRRGVSPYRMRARIALDAQMHAFAQPIFVLGMKCGPAANRL